MSVLSVLALLVAAPISGAPSSPSSVRCEAPGAKVVMLPVAGPTRKLSASVHLVRQEPGLWVSGYVAPAAGLLFVLPGKNNYAGVQVYVNPYEPEKMKIALTQPGFNEGHINFAEAPVDATVSISANLEHGVLTVAADGIRAKATVNDKVIDHSALMCARGTFDFLPEDGLALATPSR